VKDKLILTIATQLTAQLLHHIFYLCVNPIADPENCVVYALN